MHGTVHLIAAPVPDRYDVTPGLLGFAVVFTIGVALWLLLRSLNRHLGRIQVPHDERAVARRGLASRRYAPVVPPTGQSTPAPPPSDPPAASG